MSYRKKKSVVSRHELLGGIILSLWPLITIRISLPRFGNVYERPASGWIVHKHTRTAREYRQYCSFLHQVSPPTSPFYKKKHSSERDSSQCIAVMTRMITTKEAHRECVPNRRFLWISLKDVDPWKSPPRRGRSLEPSKTLGFQTFPWVSIFQSVWAFQAMK